MHIRRAAAALSIALATDVGMAGADEFDDFRIPEHRTLSWTGSLNGSGSRSRGNEGTSAESGAGRSGSLSGAVSTQTLWYRDSDPVFTTLSARVSASGTRNRSSFEGQSSLFPPTLQREFESASQFVREGWFVSASDRRYPWTVPIGFSLTLNAQGDYLQSWRSDDETESQSSQPPVVEFTRRLQNEQWRYLTQVSGRAWAGVGRVRDATGVYDAMVLERRLREMGVVTRDLTIPARQRLIDLMYARGDVRVHDRGAREVWRGIERILRDDGALAEGGLDGYSVFRAAEPHLGSFFGTTSDGVPTSPVQRLRGGLLGIMVRGDHFDQRDRLDASRFEQLTIDGVPQPPNIVTTNQNVHRFEDDMLGGVEAEYHRPMGARWQLDARGEVSIPLTKEDVALVTSERVSLAYMVADRWLASASIQHQWLDEVRTSGATAGDTWQWSYGATISYYLEDRTTLNLSFAEVQQWRRGDPIGDPPDFNARHDYNANGQVALGISYRFAGWFNAPGLSWGPQP